MMKTVNGGGGTGNRKVISELELKIAYDELTNNNPDFKIILEKYLLTPRHFEIQVIIDNNGVYILGGRDCSFQKFYQKIFESTPTETDFLHDMEEYAYSLADKAWRKGYRGLATIEFLISLNKLFFNECNPRLQVEFAVSQMQLPGIDFIELQFWIAAGKTVAEYLACKNICGVDDNERPLSAQQIINQLKKNDSVIEARINAVEGVVYNGNYLFNGTQGNITELKFPKLAGVEIDWGIAIGTEVNTHICNSMIATVRVRGENYKEALKNLKDVLEKIVITGVKTNLEYCIFALEHLSTMETPPTTETSRIIDVLYMQKLAEQEKSSCFTVAIDPSACG